MKKRFPFPVAVVIVSVMGCATVPKESVDLSIELTKMIRSAEASHLATLQLFLDERKQRADDFLKNTWTPKFMQNAMRDSHILDTLKAQHTDVQREVVMKEFSEDAASVISERRASMMGAIDQIGEMLEDSIRAHYEDMLTVNQALTAHIRSVADVNATQTMILDALKIDPKALLPVDKINGVLEKILSYQGDAEEILKYVEEAKTILKGK
jgi:hypothetical protein